MSMALHKRLSIMHSIAEFYKKHPGMTVLKAAPIYGDTVNFMRHWMVQMEDEGYLRKEVEATGFGSTVRYRYFVTDKPVPPIAKALAPEPVRKKVMRDELVAALFGPARVSA